MRASYGGLLLASLMLFGGALVSGDAAAQQFPVTQPASQTPDQVDLLATVQDNESAEAVPSITSIDEAIKAISRKDRPVHNFLAFDGRSSAGVELTLAERVTAKGGGQPEIECIALDSDSD